MGDPPNIEPTTAVTPTGMGPLAQVRLAVRQTDWRAYGLIAVLLVIALGFQVLTNGLFFTPRNLALLLRQTSITALAAVGVVLVIVSGNIDLSIGSAVGLCAIVAAVLHKVLGWPVVPVVLATLALGAAMGAWQGFVTSVLRVPSFVVTLGGLLIFRGIGLVITEGNTIATFSDAFKLIGQGFLAPVPSVGLLVAFYLIFAVSILRRRTVLLRYDLGASSIGALVAQLGIAAVSVVLAAIVLIQYQGFPIPVAIVAIVALILGFLARRTRFGRHIYAVGGNREAALLAGVGVTGNVFLVFVVMGLLYGIDGLIFASRLNGAPPTGALFLELDAIAAAVIGGTSLMGGSGTIRGALLGALLMESVRNGLSLMNVPTFYQLIVSGLILIFAVFLDMTTKPQTK